MREIKSEGGRERESVREVKSESVCGRERKEKRDR